jgi:cell division protease FtsH
MFSKAAIWSLWLWCCFTLFKQFESKSANTGASVPYSEFLERVKNNRIKEATIDEAARTVTAVTTEGTKIKSQITILDRGLVSDLVSNNVKFDVKAPEEQSFLSQIFISWFPMLLLIGVGCFLCAKCKAAAKGHSPLVNQKQECWMILTIMSPLRM